MPGLGYFEIGRKLHGASSRAVAIPSRSTLRPLSSGRNDLEKIAQFLGIHDIFYLTLNVIRKAGAASGPYGPMPRRVTRPKFAWSM